MNVAIKLTAFAAATATVFGLAFGVGSMLDPIAPEDEVNLSMGDTGESGGHSGMDMGDASAAEQTPSPTPAGAIAAAAPVAELPGLAVSSQGYTLRVEDVTPGEGDAVEIAFDITSPDGGPVLNFDTVHEKQMHLIVVRRDLSYFQHVHPDRDEQGTWRIPVNLSEAGVYRFFADFAPAALGKTITLGADVFVPGEYTPSELPEATSTWSEDGYEVTLSGTPAAGTEAELTFTLSRNGSELTDLEGYLGAFGHLVSLRSGDLAYLHTHPAEEASADDRGGPEVRFGTTFPTAGRYRLYLNFAHEGEVRTAEFTVEVPQGPGAPATAPSQPDTTGSSEPAESGSQPGSDVHSGH